MATPMNVATYASQFRAKINEFLRSELKACGYGELVPGYGSVLSVVYENGGHVQIKTINDSLYKQKTTVTESINRLVELGYLTKETSSADARFTYVQATDKALAFQEDFMRISRELTERIFRGMSGEDQQQLADLMVRVIENLQ